jgi:acyl-CoA reductase-like NAD-dependent aldehyde dehydrogenase
MAMTGATDGGFFYEPTIISGVAEGVRIVDEEQFGPVLPILSYKTETEALLRANATEYGLGGSVWSTDKAAANEMAAKLQAGTVWVNDHMSLTGAPFGGFKSSGLGRELGIADVDTFTECQTLKLAK